jgi:hypothetical protein
MLSLLYLACIAALATSASAVTPQAAAVRIMPLGDSITGSPVGELEVNTVKRFT